MSVPISKQLLYVRVLLPVCFMYYAILQFLLLQLTSFPPKCVSYTLYSWNNYDRSYNIPVIKNCNFSFSKTWRNQNLSCRKSQEVSLTKSEKTQQIAQMLKINFFLNFSRKLMHLEQNFFFMTDKNIGILHLLTPKPTFYDE